MMSTYHKVGDGVQIVRHAKQNSQHVLLCIDQLRLVLDYNRGMVGVESFGQ